MRNILTELSDMPPIHSDQEAFLVYATHQFEGGRVNSEPQLKMADGPDAYKTIKEWLLDDNKVVDFNIRPVSAEYYRAVRMERVKRHLVGTFLSHVTLRNGRDG